MTDGWFGVLGPLAVSVDGADRTPQAAKVQSLLALLVVNAGSVVPASDIIDELWRDEAPDTALTALYVYVSQLRQQLNPGVPARDPRQMIQTARPGYRLSTDSCRSDLQEFRGLAAQGALALDDGDPAEAARLLRAALALWRGPALSGVESGGLLHQQAIALDEHRLAVHEQLIEAELARGNHAAALPELTWLTRQHPLRERLAAQLMLALYRSGRQAEALTVYQRARATLGEELGVEPGPELREMQRCILVGDVPTPAGAATAGASRPSAESARDVGNPAQLLPTIPDFTGRAEPLQVVLDLMATERVGVAPACCEITGPGGAGKTALALHAAQLLRAQFPHGQLFGAMRGSTQRPADPADVLSAFLVALGLDGRFVPETLEERSRLFRTRLAGRRLLIVLDDAAAESQVRPLLPGTPDCAVLITARSRLLGIEGVTRVTVDMLDPLEAQALLARMVGAQRTAAEPEATAQVALLCGYLPLAVRIAGARLSARPHRTIAEFADSLADERGRLDELVAGDLEVRASIGLSYRACTPVQQRALRLVSSLRLDDFPAWIVAVLLHTDLRAGTKVLDELVDAQLVQAVGRDEAGQARYQLHDLVRIYADELVDDDPKPVRNDALRRLLDALVELLATAEALMLPTGKPPADAPDPGRAPPAVLELTRAGPLRWANSEFRMLTRGLELAHGAGAWQLAVRFADLLTWLLDLRSDWHGWRSNQAIGMDAALRSGDQRAQALMLRRQGDLEWDLGRARAAVAAYTRAACLFRRLGDRHATARAQLGLTGVYADRGPLRRAAALLAQVEPVFAEFGDRRGQAQVLRHRGLLDRDQGRLDSAARSLLQSADVFGELGDRRWRTYVLRGLVAVRRLQGRFGEATWIAQECLTVMHELGDRRWEAFVLSSLADVEIERGQWAAAQERLSHCLELFTSVGDQRAAALTLHSLGNVHRMQDRPDEAIGLLRRGLKVFEELNDTRGRAITSLAMGRAHYAAGDPDEAVQWFGRSAALCDQIGLAVRKKEALAGREEALSAARARIRADRLPG